MERDESLLEVRNLRTYFFAEEGVVKAVDGVNLELKKRATLGIVGESGSGKSVTALSIMRLVPQPPGRIVDGEVLFEGTNLLKLTEKEMQDIRGNKISMIFQDPMTSLNPVLTIGDQIAEAIKLHQKVSRKEAWRRATEMLKLVKIPLAEERMNDYPHQFSGGMRQRVMIAMALSCNPALLIADEPTTALDVTIQAQVLDLMRNLREEFHTAIILITHDLGIIAELCTEVMVMYAGNLVEYADIENIFRNPKHPYTWGLMGSRPRLDIRRDRLEPIEGQPPNLAQLPPGCAFQPRCKYAKSICEEVRPEIKEVSPNHLVRCYLY